MKIKFIKKENQNKKSFILKTLLIAISVMFISDAYSQEYLYKDRSNSSSDLELHENDHHILIMNSDFDDQKASGIRFQTQSSENNHKSFSIFNNYENLRFSYSEKDNQTDAGDNYMTLSNTGNLGIGIDPISKFHIMSSGTMSDNIDPEKAYLNIDNGSNQLLIDPNEIYSTHELILGSAYEHDINFRNVNESNHEDLMTIKSNGNVGIDTADPISKFHVKGTGTLSRKADPLKAYLNIDDGNDQLLMDPNEIYATGALCLGSSFENSIIFRNVSQNPSITHKNLMTIKPEGNVGIGTDDPKSILHLSSMESATLRIEADSEDNDNTEEYHPMIDMLQDGGKVGAHIGFHNESNYFRIGTRSGGNSNYDRFVINHQNGNIGIGTDDPGDYKLAVNGNVRADAVTLDIGSFPDYVFKPDYQLLSLAQVEDFIRENGHLPNMPSEKEVVEEGMDVGQINVILVEKVEELTLYGITQQKEIDTLKDELNTLRAILNELVDHSKN